MSRNHYLVTYKKKVDFVKLRLGIMYSIVFHLTI